SAAGKWHGQIHLVTITGAQILLNPFKGLAVLPGVPGWLPVAWLLSGFCSRHCNDLVMQRIKPPLQLYICQLVRIVYTALPTVQEQLNGNRRMKKLGRWNSAG